MSIITGIIAFVFVGNLLILGIGSASTYGGPMPKAEKWLYFLFTLPLLIFLALLITDGGIIPSFLLW